MKPADEKINQKAAEACGWQPSPAKVGWVSMSGKLSYCVPDYCNDRNALLELYKVIDETVHAEWYDFTQEFMRLAVRMWTTETEVCRAMAVEPTRLQVIAALIVLGKWPAEWEAR